MTMRHPSDNPHTLLIVEDERSLRVAVARYLEAVGFRVLLVEQAQEAIAILSDQNGIVDLAFIDVFLGEGMDGCKLARYINKHWPQMPVFLTAGSQSPPQRHDGDAWRFFAKPYDIKEVARAAREALSAN